MSIMAQGAVYAAVYDSLVAAAPLTALLPAGGDSITAHALADMAMPYVFLGACEERAVPASGGACRSVAMTIEVFSAAHGGAEVRAILAQVGAALEPPLTMMGYRTLMQDVEALAFTALAEGKIQRAQLVVRVTCEAEEV